LEYSEVDVILRISECWHKFKEYYFIVSDGLSALITADRPSRTFWGNTSSFNYVVQREGHLECHWYNVYNVGINLPDLHLSYLQVKEFRRIATSSFRFLSISNFLGLEFALASIAWHAKSRYQRRKSYRNMDLPGSI